ncbi:MAG: protein translocase subunit SecF, partial [Flavobacteriales bacterium]|nr:protein translocase subunit SecF [Flavobacteriales bacterium]
AGLGVSYTLDQYNKVDSTISDDFRRGAMYATIFSLLVIFLYLLFRFRRWQYGLGALIAMVHDVLIVVALFSMFWGVLPFTMEVDQAFIAAILTVIGYSINDTVVVFDRIREYLGIYGNKRDQKDIINDALNSTLSRTINTSLTTFVVLLTIFILGGDNIKGFVFALMAGIVVGTYSSIFIATPSVIDMSKKLTTDKKA